MSERGRKCARARAAECGPGRRHHKPYAMVDFVQIYSTNPRPQASLPQNISVEVGATGYNEEHKKSQTRGGNRTVLRSGVGMKRHRDDGDIDRS